MRMNGVLQTLIALPRTPSEAGLIESKTEKKTDIQKLPLQRACQS